MQAADILYQLWAPDEPVWGPVATVSHVHNGKSREATSLYHRAPVEKQITMRRRRRKWCGRYQKSHLDSLDPRHIKGGSLTAAGLMTACERMQRQKDRPLSQGQETGEVGTHNNSELVKDLW